MNFMHSFGFVCRDSGVLKIAGYEIVAVKLINSKVLKKRKKYQFFVWKLLYKVWKFLQKPKPKNYNEI